MYRSGAKRGLEIQRERETHNTLTAPDGKDDNRTPRGGRRSRLEWPAITAAPP